MIRKWGCEVSYKHNDPQNKLAPRSERCMLVGFNFMNNNLNQNSYKLLSLERAWHFINAGVRDCEFHEDKPHAWGTRKWGRVVDVPAPKPLPPSEQKQFDPALADIRWSSRERKKPDRLALPVMENEDADEDESWSFFSPAEEIPTSVQVFVLEEEQPDGSLTETLYDPTEPTSLREAMRTPEFQQWRESMQEEYDSQIENKTWILVDRPKGRKVIRCRWVYKVKDDGKGNKRFKSCLVAEGFSQLPGTDYFETYSPVVKMDTLSVPC